MKIYSVQYMRAVAALSVLVGHALIHPMASADLHVRRLGSQGVMMFFVISGFIMVLIAGKGHFAPLTFLKRRITRVVPLYWIATVALSIIAVIAPAVLKTTVFSPGHLMLSMLFIPHLNPRGELIPLLKLGWTLNYEMFFYVCFAALAFLTARTRVIAITLLFAVLAVLGQAYTFTNPALATYTSVDLLPFCIGMWVGIAYLEGALPKRNPAIEIVLGAGGLGLIVLSFIIAPGQSPTPAVVALEAIGSTGLLVLGLVAEAALPRWRFGELLGDASYSIYLVHMYFVAAAVVLFRHFYHAVPVPLLVVLSLIAGGGAGILAHLYIERPLLRLMQRTPRPYGTTPPPDAVQAAEPDSTAATRGESPQSA